MISGVYAAKLASAPDVEVVLNLTVPAVHAALEAGKSVYGEKPLALALAEGRRLVESAARAGLRLGCAPDTFLGAGLQTCRKLIDDGAIGEPLAAKTCRPRGCATSRSTAARRRCRYPTRTPSAGPCRSAAAVPSAYFENQIHMKSVSAALAQLAPVIRARGPLVRSAIPRPASA